MKRYIEQDAVEKMLEDAQLISDGEFCGYCTEDVNLDSIPAADVVEVSGAGNASRAENLRTFRGWCTAKTPEPIRTRTIFAAVGKRRRRSERGNELHSDKEMNE